MIIVPTDYLKSHHTTKHEAQLSKAAQSAIFQYRVRDEAYRSLVPPVGGEERIPPAPVFPLCMEGLGEPAG